MYEELTAEIVYQLLKWMDFTDGLADRDQCDITAN
jgi:hypothetical protein